MNILLFLVMFFALMFLVIWISSRFVYVIEKIEYKRYKDTNECILILLRKNGFGKTRIEKYFSNNLYSIYSWFNADTGEYIVYTPFPITDSEERSSRLCRCLVNLAKCEEKKYQIKEREREMEAKSIHKV